MAQMVADMESQFPKLLNALQSWLHQDYDLDSCTVADAILNVAKSGEVDKILSELEQLEMRPEDEIRRVLGNHDIAIWDYVEPRELLVTLKTLCKLAV